MTISQNNGRDLTIDMIKGLGIILMVLGHSGFIFTKYIYLFHMALFFIASGYLFKAKYSESSQSVLGFIKRKFKSLWVPFFIANTIFILLNNFLIYVHIYTNKALTLPDPSNLYLVTTYSTKDVVVNIAKGLHMGNYTLLGNALWFLKTLMLISIIYCFLEFIINKISLFQKHHAVIQLIISLGFLMFGYYCSKHNYMLKGLAKVFSYYILFYIGQLLCQKKDVLVKVPKYLLIVTTFIILLVLNSFGEIRLSENHYMNPIFLLSTSILGWLLISSIAYYIKQWTWGSRILSVISRQSLYIVIFHYLAFKLVTLLQVLVYNEPMEYLSAFPILHATGIWCIVYTVVGITLPILLHSCTTKLYLLSKTKSYRVTKTA